MCDLPIRSRIYCSYETVSIAANQRLLPTLEPEDEIILDVIVHKKRSVEVGDSCLYEWQQKNNWRTAGLLWCCRPVTSFLESHINTDPLPESRTIFSFAQLLL